MPSLVADRDQLSRSHAHERRRRVRGRLLVQYDLQALVRRQTRTGRDEPTHDDVLLDAAEIVRLAADRSFREHLGGLLERRSRDEGLGRERRLRDAEEHGLRDGGLTTAFHHASVVAFEHVFLDLFVDEEVGVTDLLDTNAAEHLAHDGFDVLVVDTDALQAVNLLDFVHEPSGQFLLALHAQDVVRVCGTVLQRVAGADVIARLHLDVLALGDQVLASLIREQATVDAERGDDDLALALGVLAERNDAVDLADDGVIFGLTGFEQLGDAGQTTGDVLHLGRVARDLGDGFTGGDAFAFAAHDVGAHREEVASVEVRTRKLHRLARLGVDDRDARAEIRGARLDHDLAGKTGHFVDLLDHGDAFDEIAELHHTADLGQNRRREWIPFGHDLTCVDTATIGRLEHRAVQQAVVLALATGVVHDHELAVAIHDHDAAVVPLGQLCILEVHGAFSARLERALLDLTARCRTTDVEGTHRELRARLANRLSRDDADCLADVDAVAAGQVAPVAQRAHAAARLAGEHRADDDLFDARVLDLIDTRLVEFGVAFHDDLAREGIDHVFQHHATQDAVAERLNDFTGFFQLGDANAVERAAIELGHHGILRDVDETTREVAGVSRLERGVGQALTSAVRRNEVLQHGQTFTEVRRDRRLDDLAGRLGHQTAHGSQLTHLLWGTTSTGVSHDVDRVEAGVFDLLLRLGIGHDFAADAAHHFFRDAIGNAGPDVDDLVVALAIRNQTFLVLIDDLLELRLRGIDEILLLGRDDHVIHAHRDTAAGREAEAERAQAIRQEHGLLVAV